MSAAPGLRRQCNRPTGRCTGSDLPTRLKRGRREPSSAGSMACLWGRPFWGIDVHAAPGSLESRLCVARAATRGVGFSAHRLSDVHSPSGPFWCRPVAPPAVSSGTRSSPARAHTSWAMDLTTAMSKTGAGSQNGYDARLLPSPFHGLEWEGIRNGLPPQKGADLVEQSMQVAARLGGKALGSSAGASPLAQASQSVCQKPVYVPRVS